MGYLHIQNLYKDPTIPLFRECYALEKVRVEGELAQRPPHMRRSAVVDADKLAVLTAAQAIADEWGTPERVPIAIFASFDSTISPRPSRYTSSTIPVITTGVDDISTALPSSPILERTCRSLTAKLLKAELASRPRT